MKPFDIVNPEPTIPLVANIPHSSAVVPKRYRAALALNDEELAREHSAIVDWFTDELYAPIVSAGGAALVSRVSRLVVDTERFDDDSRESMAERGMGVIYERTTAQRVLRSRPSAVAREEILSSVYRPYHAALTSLCEGVLARFGWCVLLDCHSFPAHALPYERDHTLLRPDMCLGTDEHHSPEPLVQMLEEVTAMFGWSCARNTPFAGTIVPLSLYGDRRVASIMIEFNRKLYMDEEMTTRHGGLTVAQRWVEVMLERLEALRYTMNGECTFTNTRR